MTYKGNMVVVIVCVSCVTLLELVALSFGINGKLFTLTIGSICGLGGFTINKLFGRA